MKKLLVIFVVLMVSFAVSFKTFARAKSSLVGKEAPEISAQKWINTAPLSLKSLKGKVVVVEFFATWCPPCKASVPHLKKIYGKYRTKGFVVVSLSSEDKNTIKKFIRENHIMYPIGASSNSGMDYGVSGIPHSVVIGRDGIVAWEGHPMDEAFEKAIVSSLKGTKRKKRFK